MSGVPPLPPKKQEAVENLVPTESPTPVGLTDDEIYAQEELKMVLDEIWKFVNKKATAATAATAATEKRQS